MALELATAVLRVHLDHKALGAELTKARSTIQKRLSSLKVTVWIYPRIHQGSLAAVRAQLSAIGVTSGGGGAGGGSAGGGRTTSGGSGGAGGGRSGGGGAGGVNMSRNASIMSGASRVATGRSLFGGNIGKFVKGSAQIATGILGAQAALNTLMFPVEAVKEFADFTSEMTRLRAVTQATASEFAMLERVAKDTAQGTKFTLVETSAAMASLAQKGVGTEDLRTMTPLALEFATATRVGAEEASSMLVEIMNQMQLSSDEATRVADVLSRFSVKTAADVTSLGSAFSYVGPLAKEAGLSIEEVGAAIAFLAKAGIKGSKGGTTIRNILGRLADTDTMDRARKILGQDFTLALKNAKGEFIGFPEVVAQFETAVKGTLDPMDTLNLLMKLFRQRGAAGFAAMLSAGSDELERFESIASDTSITTKELASEQMDNMTGAIQEFQTALSVAMVESIEPFSESIISMIDNLKGFVTAIPEAIGGLMTLKKAFTDAVGDEASGLYAFAAKLAIIGKFMGPLSGAIYSGVELGRRIGATELGGRPGRNYADAYYDWMHPESNGIPSVMTPAMRKANGSFIGPEPLDRSEFIGPMPSTAAAESSVPIDTMALKESMAVAVDTMIGGGNAMANAAERIAPGFSGLADLSRKIQTSILKQDKKEEKAIQKATESSAKTLKQIEEKIDGQARFG